MIHWARAKRNQVANYGAASSWLRLHGTNGLGPFKKLCYNVITKYPQPPGLQV